MNHENDWKFGHTRRSFLQTSAAIGTSLVLSRSAVMFAAEKNESEKEGPNKVGPAEDLMREHGVLRRVLLIYEEASRRLMKSSPDLRPETLKESAGIIRGFVEDYHEKLEEDYLFPRFRKAGKQVDLVEVLLRQHQKGRLITEQVQRLSEASTFKDSAARKRLAAYLGEFNRMYRPHAAREDTVLFPDFHKIVKLSEYDELGEAFEDKENQLFGEDGFENMVRKVADIEKKLGIYDLAQFTPG